MGAWIGLLVGCLFVVGGLSALKGGRAARLLKPNFGGWAAVLMGGGFVADTLPRVLGWSSGVGLLFSMVGFALVVAGAVLLLRRGGRAR